MADMNLEVERGTVHAVVGENGAGKSTLMKSLAGAVRPDGGQIIFDDAEAVIDGPNMARQLGIGIVYQELSLFPERSVLANLFINREPTRHGLVSLSAMEERSRSILAQLGLHVDVRQPLGRLSFGEQQLVELCRALLENPRLLILDEPNSALNKRESERLFAVLRDLRERGMTMLYISHRLEEVFAIADRITITQNGRDVMTAPTTQLTIHDVIENMIGQQREALFPPTLEPNPGAKASRLEVKGLTGGNARGVSFSLHSGEIVGIAGLEGSGVTDIMAMLFGARSAEAGTVTYPDGGDLPRSTTQAARRGVCLVPADRKRNGLMLDQSILFNIANVVVGARNDGPFWLSRERERRRAQRQIDALAIKAGSPHALAHSLSGGNQQKVVIGKWLESGPSVFLLDDPTRGVDVGAKREIYGLIRRISADGGVVLFSSTELPELVGICDRILVVYQGRIVGIAEGDDLRHGPILHMMNTGERPGQSTTTVQ